MIGSHLLEETQYHAQHDHYENDRCRPQIARQKRKHAQRNEQEDQRILDVAQEAHQGRLPLLAGNLVSARAASTAYLASAWLRPSNRDSSSRRTVWASARAFSSN